VSVGESESCVCVYICVCLKIGAKGNWMGVGKAAECEGVLRVGLGFLGPLMGTVVEQTR
jgi:hypothetical protein